METVQTKKKFPWKFVIITLLILATVITTVVMVRRNKRKNMVEALKVAGTSLTDDVLNSMSYADIKKLYESTPGVAK